MSLKKMSIDRQLVYDLYQNIDFQFANTLLSTNSFPFHHIPNFEEIAQVLDQVEHTHSHRRGTWTISQEKLLNLVIFGICVKNQSPPISLTQAEWEQASQMFDCHNWKACRNKWLSDKQVKASWTIEEDRTLIELYNQCPKKWCEIAIDLWKICKTPHIRQGKQCRDRWVNKLDPNIIKLPWSRKEELQLFEEVKKKGKRWAEISYKIFHLKRTENTIKNRFYNMLKQEENKLKLKKMTKDEKEEIIITHIIKQLRNQTKMNSNNEESESKKEPNNTVFDIRKFSTKYLENCELVIYTSRKITKLN